MLLTSLTNLGLWWYWSCGSRERLREISQGSPTASCSGCMEEPFWAGGEFGATSTGNVKCVGQYLFFALRSDVTQNLIRMMGSDRVSEWKTGGGAMF